MKIRKEIIEKVTEAVRSQQKGQRQSFGDDGRRSAETGELSIAKYLRGVAFGAWDNAENEKQEFEAARAMGITTGEVGGYIVPTKIMTELIELLKNKAAIRQLNPMKVPMGNAFSAEIPSKTQASTAYWIADNAAITPSDLALGQKTVSLRGVAALVKVSERLIIASDPAADAIVKKDIVEQLALAEDAAAISGTGGAQPTGILNTAGILTQNAALALSFDTLIDAMAAIEDANASYTGWIVNPLTKAVLRKLKDLDGRYIWQESIQAGEPSRLLGLPAVTSKQIARTNILLGDFGELALCEGKRIAVSASKEAGDAFEKNQIWFKAVNYIDFIVRQPSAFCNITNAMA